MSETIEQWAERVAPNVPWDALRRVTDSEVDASHDDLEACRAAGLIHYYPSEGWGLFLEKHDALLAYRDELATGVAPLQIRALLEGWCTPGIWTALHATGLASSGTLTNLGREIARVLKNV